VRPPFFYLPPPHPGCSGILSATRSGTNPPHTQTVAYPTTQASNTRLPHDLLSGAQTNRPHTPPAAPPRAPLPDRHKKAAPGTGTATLHPHPRPHHPPPPNRLGKSTLFLPRLPRPRRPEKRRPAPLSAPTHTPAPGKSSGARPHTSASSPTCTSLRLPAHAPHPSSPSRHPATPEKTSPRIPPAASPRLPAPPSASPPRQAQKKRQPAKGCRASFKPPGDQLPLIWL
jgi:hypothetical protein